MLNKNDFKIGDVVRLNSGGPDLTICAIYGDGTIDCAYATKNNKIKTTGSLKSSMFYKPE